MDMAAVRQAYPPSAPMQLLGQETLDAKPGVTVQIPPLPSTTLRSPKGKDEAQIRKAIEAARLKAKRQLQNRLRDVYFEELDRQQEEAIAALEPEFAKAAEAARKQKLSLFRKYAEDKGFRLARLALLAGFPDPDPKSQNPMPTHAIAKQFRTEADQIRKELVQIDRDYDAAVESILRALEGSKDELLTSLRAKFGVAKAEAEDRANREAEIEMARLNKAFGQTLAEEREITVPGTPGRTLPAPAPSTLAKLPKLDPVPGEDRSSAIQDQLTIWQAVKGYRMVTSRSAGRDGTSEFLEWLRSHLPGP